MMHREGVCRTVKVDVVQERSVYAQRTVAAYDTEENRGREGTCCLQEGAEDAKGVPKVGGRQPQRFVPFTQGARDCVGQTLARLNLTTTLAQLFGSFSFRLAEEVG